MTRTPPFDRLILKRGSPATLYAFDGASNPTALAVIVSNARTIPMVGSRGDVIQAHVASGVAIAPGQVLQIPSQASVWYVVAKTLQVSRGVLFDPGTSMALLALPYALTVRRALKPTATSGALDSYGAPRRVDTAGHPTGITETTFQVRCGLSNEFNPLMTAVGGVVPGAVETLYAPLGSGLQADDEVTLSDGRKARVQTLNALDADGTRYALQGILDTSVGSGYA